MRKLILFLIASTTAMCMAQANAPTLKFKTLSVGTDGGIQLILLYQGKPPADPKPYIDAANWTIEWQTGDSGSPTRVSVVGRPVFAHEHLTLQLAANNPGEALPALPDAKAKQWRALLRAQGISMVLISNTPTVTRTGTSCDGSTAESRFFCPPGAGAAAPDLSFSGSFLAGGGTNPLYQFQVKGGLLFPKRLPGVPMDIGVTTDVEINQNEVPPIRRTTFDPDSISAAFVLQNHADFETSPLEGMRFQLNLPEGEFSRSDPSSNIIAAGLATFDFRSWQQRRKDPTTGLNTTGSIYFTMYPLLGVETGRNLNRPSMVESIPVDLSRYKGIFRGYAGADAKLGYSTDKGNTDTFAITGTYRVRFPAIDEPFFATEHQVTTIAMTTKARHWVETDLSYSLPTFQYLTLSAIYQYGELPPFFSFVDHKLTLGFKLQAMQMKGKGRHNDEALTRLIP
jgi:hypothetical protein